MIYHADYLINNHERRSISTKFDSDEAAFDCYMDTYGYDLQSIYYYDAVNHRWPVIYNKIQEDKKRWKRQQ